MAAATLSPRVRLMAVCDGVRESKTEFGVYHLRGVRQRIVTQTFPFVAIRLWFFGVLSSYHPGEYPSYVRVIDDSTDKAISYGKLAPDPRFEFNDQTLAAMTRLRCSFPRAGRYTLQVWFYQDRGNDILKGELPFSVETEGG